MGDSDQVRRNQENHQRGARSGRYVAPYSTRSSRDCQPGPHAAPQSLVRCHAERPSLDGGDR